MTVPPAEWRLHHGSRRTISAAPSPPPRGGGTLEQKLDGNTRINRVIVRWGRLRLGSLDLQVAGPADTVTAAIGDQPLEVGVEPLDEGRLRLNFEPAIILEEGGPGLQVTIG